MILVAELSNLSSTLSLLIVIFFPLRNRVKHCFLIYSECFGSFILGCIQNSTTLWSYAGCQQTFQLSPPVAGHTAFRDHIWPQLAIGLNFAEERWTWLPSVYLTAFSGPLWGWAMFGMAAAPSARVPECPAANRLCWFIVDLSREWELNLRCFQPLWFRMTWVVLRQDHKNVFLKHHASLLVVSI